MKKIKPILSIALVCAMLICVIPFSAGAVYDSEGENYYTFDSVNYVSDTLDSDTATYREKLRELRWYFVGVDHYFNIGALDMPNDGQACPYYTYESFQSLGQLLKDLHEQVENSSRSQSVTYTDEEIRGMYDTVKSAVSQMVLKKDELYLFITRVCELETNNNGYYSDDLWNDFTTKLNNAKEVYADESITDIRVSNAYWDLFHSFNALCLSNPLPGDVDNDGRVSILDATLLQKGLAKQFTVNASQQYVGYIRGESIASVTEIQKYLAGLSSNENWCADLKLLQGAPDTTSFRRNKIIYADIDARLFPGYWD